MQFSVIISPYPNQNLFYARLVCIVRVHRLLKKLGVTGITEGNDEEKYQD
jgi:hypothetical protein